jgi:hypothetical protein
MKLSKNWLSTKRGTGNCSEVAAQGFLLELDHAIAAVAEAPETVVYRQARRVSVCFPSLSVHASLSCSW